MEESDDGTRVSGNWEGRIDQNGAVSGTWTDAFNPAIVLPFFIRPLGGYLVIPPFDMRPSSGVTYAPPVPEILDLDRQLALRLARWPLGHPGICW